MIKTLCLGHKLKVLIMMLAVFFIIITYYLNYSLYRQLTTKETTIIIPKGLSRLDIAKLLSENHIISHKYIFVIVSKISNHLNGKKLIAGEYSIKKGQNMLQVLEKIEAGTVIVHKFTIPEGMLTHEITKLALDAAQIIIDLKDGDIDLNTQGIFLPETYLYLYGMTVKELLQRASQDLDSFLENAWKTRDPNIDKYIYSKIEALTLASIVEKESRIDKEKPDIAGVYINRLKQNMRLQADPTVIFALTGGKTFDVKLSRSDLAFASPYNTYHVFGLPPAPICNPGKSSIHATLHPTQHNYLYFVADGSGGHIFAENFTSHLNNIKIYRNKNKNQEIKAISK